jgi:hypothetical protein
MHSRNGGHDRLASATHGSRGAVWDNGAIMTYLDNTCISCLRASNFLTSSQQASCKSSCQASIQRRPHTHAKKVRINGVGMRAGTSGCMRISLSEKREEVSFCEMQGGIRGRGKWIMDYEIACDGPMSPEVRESHAGQRLAEEGG